MTQIIHLVKYDSLFSHLRYYLRHLHMRFIPLATLINQNTKMTSKPRSDFIHLKFVMLKKTGHCLNLFWVKSVIRKNDVSHR